MEWLLVELATYASTAVHAVMTFVLWLSVVVATAAVLVFNRLTEQLMRLVDDEPKMEPVRVESSNNDQKDAA